MKKLVLLLVTVLLIAGGCGGDGGNTPAVNLTGTWQGILSGTDTVTGFTDSMVIDATFVQTNTSVAGSSTVIGDKGSSSQEPLSGVANVSTYTINFPSTQGMLTFSGGATDTTITLTGTDVVSGNVWTLTLVLNRISY